MHQISINDQLYADVSRRAADAGFPSVEAYVVDVLQHDVSDGPDDIQGFFTPERLAEIDRAAAQADAGQVMSIDEVSERFRRKSTDDARPTPSLEVVVTDLAYQDLDEIREWNSKRYGLDHAIQYLAALVECLRGLGSEYVKGRAVDLRPGYRYLLLGKRKRGHRHLAVYRIDERNLTVLRIFHTAQDWENKLP